jgi:hypothetical protein
LMSRTIVRRWQVTAFLEVMGSVIAVGIKPATISLRPCRLFSD